MTNKSNKDNNRWEASLHQVAGFLWKMCRDASHLLLSLLLLFVYFWPYHPYFFNVFSAFYTCLYFFNSIATKSEGCGLRST